MSLAVSALCALALVGPLARSLKRYPCVWYAAAAVLAAAAAVSALAGFSMPVLDAVFAPVRSGAFPFALLCAVMYTGVFRPGSAPRVRLMQIRRPLAIAACIVSCGHVAFVVFSMSAPYPLDVQGLVQGALCAFLVICCVVLGITSPVRVVECMRQSVWRKIHMLSYPFYPALCLHAALLSKDFSAVEAGAYAVCGVVYAVLRLRRFEKDGGFSRR